jgi:hypothetical protein
VTLLLRLALTIAPSLVAAACASAAGNESASPVDYTLNLVASSSVTVGTEPLRIELVAVKDGRCPTEVQCIWAGHATVTLRVQRSESPPETVLIGTPAPAAMNLPNQASVGPYHFGLLSLEPANSSASKATLSQYRATVRVTKP